MEKPPFDPEATNPAFSPDETQPHIPKTEQRADEERLMALMEKVRQQDAELKAQMKEVLEQLFHVDVEILDFKEIGPRRFQFTVDVGGEAKEVVANIPE